MTLSILLSTLNDGACLFRGMSLLALVVCKHCLSFLAQKLCLLDLPFNAIYSLV
jgi:hypothetical protein